MADTPNPIQIQKYLGGLDYPASRDDVVSTAKGNGAEDDVVEALGKIPDREYDGPTGVSKALGEL